MKIDFLILRGAVGGIETTINRLLDSDAFRNDEVRVVQVFYEGFNYLHRKESFYPLLFGTKGYDVQRITQEYYSFLTEHGLPDVIISTAAPFLNYTAKDALRALNANIPVISWLHTTPDLYENAGLGGNEYLKMADYHFAISDKIERMIHAAVPDACVIRTYNPCSEKLDINNNKNLSTAIHKEDGPLKLVYVGRISQEKRILTILEAMTMVKGDLQLDIYGSGEDSEYGNRIHEFITANGLADKILWHGWADDPWGESQDADYSILASDYEGMPLTAIESLSYGIPVISTMTSGIDELVQPGITGFLFNHNAPEELAEILQMTIDGKIAITDKRPCFEAASPYQYQNATYDFRAKLECTAFSNDFNDNSGILPSVYHKYPMYMNDKISIIIPCHNSEKYIRFCLDSILSQTIPLRMLEIICVDDCSEDRTVDILKEYENKCPDLFIIVCLDQHAGSGQARNIGMNYASGNYLGFIDSDDLLFPDALNDLYKKIKINNCNMSVGDITCFRNGSFIKYHKGCNDMKNIYTKRQYLASYGIINSCCGKLYDLEWLKNNNITFPDTYYGEDGGFTLQCILLADKIYNIAETVYAYRYSNGDSVMHNTPQNYYQQLFNSDDYALDNIMRHINIAPEYAEIEAVYFYNILYKIIQDDNIDDQIKIYSSKYMLKRFPDFLQNTYIKQHVSTQELVHIKELTEC